MRKEPDQEVTYVVERLVEATHITQQVHYRVDLPFVGVILSIKSKIEGYYITVSWVIVVLVDVFV
jgi:hypothetical protein